MNIFICLTIILSSTHYVGSITSNDFYEDELDGNCICVPYWQCKEDFSGLVQDGMDLMDLRVHSSTTQLGAIGPCTGDFDVCCKVQCGMRKKESISTRKYNVPRKSIFGFRIMGDDNNEADFGEFPWMLGVLESRAFRCGASLIHPQVALTAAHCVTKDGLYKVRAGEWNWKVQDEPEPHQDRLVKKKIIHPFFSPRTLQNDIALLVLESPFRLTANVGIMCLPPANSNFDYASCIATGWGRNSYLQGAYQPTLKKIQLPIIPYSHCLPSLRFAKMGPLFNLHQSFICAGGESNRDTCRGDGGSPLVCPLKNEPDRYQQAGIVAWGLSCGLVNTPGVYVNVPLFRDWIDDEMLNSNFDVNIYKAR